MKITIKNSQKKIPINPKRIKKTILNILSRENIKKSGEITVCLVNDKEIRGLNFRYLGKDKPTDVLAFDISDNATKKYMVADIVISADAVVRQAGVFKTSIPYELNLYVAHGILHLLGYDDRNSRQRKIMQDMADEAIKGHVHT